VISGNGVGIELTANANNNAFSGNLIGTDKTGTAAIPNGIGISIVSGTENAFSNVVAFNTGNGIEMAAGIGNAFGGSIHSNGGLGIDLGANGLSPNDAGDTDNGPNQLFNFPFVSSAIRNADGTTTIRGSVHNNELDANVSVGLFVSASCDPSGHGEGERFLEGRLVATDPGTFEFTVIGLTPGQFITATATSDDGSTSEFSACTQVVLGTEGL
jgi:hypothetical protein